MSWFKRALGMQAPKIAIGGHAYVDGYGPLRDHYCVKVRTGIDLSVEDKQVGPVFNTAAKAEEFADWCNGLGSFSYGVGAV